MTDDPYQYLDVSWRSALLLCLMCPVITTAITLFFRKIETKASRYLALFLLVFCINIIPQVIGFSGFYQAFPWLTFAPFSNELWLGPLLLLHTLALTKHQPPWFLKWLMVPAVMQTLYYCIVFVSFGDYKDKWAFNDAFHVVYIMPVELLLTVTLSLFCMGLAFKHIALYRNELLDLESDQESYDVSWLKWMIGLIGVLITCWSAYLVLYLLVPDLSYPDQYPFHTSFLFIILILSQRALSSIRFPFPAPIANKSLAIDSENSDSEEASSKQVDLVAQITDGLANAKWYLNKQFSLSDMARALNSNETYVSKAINTGFNKNFNTLINEARVGHAIALIESDPAYKLADVMYDSGFSSKASFNRSFKSISGQTPSQFQASVN